MLLAQLYSGVNSRAVSYQCYVIKPMIRIIQQKEDKIHLPLCKAALESAQVASRVHHEDLKKPTKFVSL
jgi:hypothetical protein